MRGIYGTGFKRKSNEMKYWKPAGPGAFELGPWRVQKDWVTGLWDIYRDGELVATNRDDAPTAMAEAERMGA